MSWRKSERPPPTRADCLPMLEERVSGRNPCRRIACKHNILSEISPKCWRKQSCVLDVIYKNPDGMNIYEIGVVLGVSSQAINVTLDSAMDKVGNALIPGFKRVKNTEIDSVLKFDIIDLYDGGMTNYTHISKEVSASVSSVRRICIKHKGTR